MSEPFDPDAYLKDLNQRRAMGPAAAPAPFDPDAYLRDLEGRKKFSAWAPWRDSASAYIPEAERAGRPVLTEQEMAGNLKAGQGGILKEAVVKPALAGAQGLGYNGLDELAAGTEVAKRNLTHPLDSLRQLVASPKDFATANLSDYRNRLSDWRQMTDESVRDNPAAYLVGSVLSPAPFGKASALSRIAGLAANAGLAGAGDSRHGVMDGNVAGLAKDAAGSAVLGGALGAGGEVVGKGLNVLGGKLAQELQGAKNAVIDKVTGQVDKGIASAQGSYRSAVQSASRDLEVLEREAQGLGTATPPPSANPRAQQAGQFLATPEAQALRDMVLENKLKTGPDRIAEVAGLKTKLQDLTGNRLRDIATKSLEQFETAPGKFVSGLGRSVGQRALLGVGGASLGALGAALTGQDMGNAMSLSTVGALAGIGPGALQFARNQAASPALQARALQALQGLISKSQPATQALAAGTAKISGIRPEQGPVAQWMDGLGEPTEEQKAKARAAALRLR